MRILHLSLVAAGIAVAVAGAAGYRAVEHFRHLPDGDPWSSDTLQWQAQVAQQALRSQRIGGGVIFLGDSLTVGLTTSNIAPRSENFGIGGDTIDGLIKRLPRYDLSNANAIVVQIGINNWRADRLTNIGMKYRHMLGLLPPGIPITVVSLAPVNARTNLSFADARFPAAWLAANLAIAQACAARTQCLFVDISKMLSDRNGVLRPRYDSGDGLHLSSVGYDLWERSVEQRLSQEHVLPVSKD